MAISTENTYFGKSTDGKVFKKLVDIKEFPALGGAPSTIEKTTLSEPQHTFLNGLKNPGNLEFLMNYDIDDFKTLKNVEGVEGHYCVAFGKNGEDGILFFDGELSCWVDGGGVEAVVDMRASIAVSTEIKLAEESDGITFSIS